jgi:hypothetical protein
MRWLLHGTLLLAFAGAGAALLVWPQWLCLDGSRTALLAQRRHERKVKSELEAARTAEGALPAWKQDSRKLFLAEEMKQVPALVRTVARREQVKVAEVRILSRAGSRWSSLGGRPAVWSGEEAGVGADIGPRTVKLVLVGKFDSIFRTVATLSQQRRFFIPDRWDMAPRADGGGAPGKALRADVLATVFVIQPHDEAPGMPAASGPVAAAAPLGE